ncbi:TonB family protein [Mucilaginibacter sp. X4EP1]|uniref:energy transducer TonB n=1 Tax=Mucilaginibacter sp. X4EP1 TaxID=2723092 RepID=UPI00216AA428|nr:energy transducer TonB [Mucilaginibacter sp. X4EP1]MCS3816440.1 TonB family protein [Mucilaginibacter sp. X4EP1]
MKFLYTLIFLLALSQCLAQKQNVYYLKNDGRYVDVRDSADYIRVVREPDSASTLYNVFEFYKKGEKKLIGKSSAIDPPVFEGQFVTYYKSGRKRTLATYKGGRVVGAEYDFYPNGRIYLEKQYPDNGNLYNDFDNNLIIKSAFDSLGTALVKDGNGYYKGYDDKFAYVEEEGPIKDGKRDSLWNGVFKEYDTKFTETYATGVLISGTATGKDGKITSYAGKRGVPPSFKGGLDAFYKYLGGHIHYPEDELNRNIQGKVFISFVVEKDGKVSNIKVLKSVTPNIDAEAIRVIKNSPLWVPATLFGKPVRVYYSIPISFSLN